MNRLPQAMHVWIIVFSAVLTYCVLEVKEHGDKINELEEKAAHANQVEAISKEIPTKIVFSLQELQQEIDVLRVRIDELEEARRECKQTIEK